MNTIENVKEELYEKINPLINQIVGRLTMLRDTQQGKEAHELALKLAILLDDWINE